MALAEESKHLTAFEILQKGKFEYNVLPFGLANSSAAFLILMNKIVGTMLFKGLINFADDILIYSKTMEEHCKALEKVLGLFREHNMRVNASKVELAAKEVSYLGLVLSKDGARPSPSKTAAIDAMKEPTNLRELQGAHW